jgi:hypothetical protein
LRSLEEFRKNPCVKIPPKSHSANFQNLGKFKNLIFILKGFFQLPAQPAQQPAGPFAFWPTQPHWPPSSSFTAPACLFCRPLFPSLARLACAHLWCIPQNTFSSLIHAFHSILDVFSLSPH